MTKRRMQLRLRLTLRALWWTLKMMMLDTLAWGWKVPIRRQPDRPRRLITSLEYYEARQILTQLAATLQLNGWVVDIDNGEVYRRVTSSIR
ncbi:hypothetical protein BJX63DRAFT_429421 [Aspergillus granulosus]|uniref:Uncharacterized protein n=1 Tax=Aspergillus granulosus TaxID=176169 RepID=A0ABR4HRU8_9EURO